jgi:cellulose synthase/poly-beta-1,6-N-acetylglucosamine synthase-like glycosyltransferase
VSTDELESFERRPVSVGVMAYNEETAILDALLAISNQEQNHLSIDEVIVVISGSIDDTERIARSAALEDPRIRIVVEPMRKGKIHSVIHFLEMARNEICVIACADVVPDKDCFDNLIRPFLSDSNVGMAGPRVIPCESESQSSIAINLHRELWAIHHNLALVHPKLGEVVMVRKSFVAIPPSVSGCDEVMLESAVHLNGGLLAYVPSAIVQNFGPTDISEYIQHRRRIHGMHLVARRELGYEATTMPVRHAVLPLCKEVFERPSGLGWILILIAVESKCRLDARLDARRGNRNYVWEPAESARLARTAIRG